MKFIGPRNRPARREMLSPTAYGAITPGGYDPDREPGESMIAWDEVARGFFWTMGAVAGAAVLSVGGKLINGRA